MVLDLLMLEECAAVDEKPLQGMVDELWGELNKPEGVREVRPGSAHVYRPNWVLVYDTASGERLPHRRC